jgi:hypothetical protein
VTEALMVSTKLPAFRLPELEPEDQPGSSQSDASPTGATPRIPHFEFDHGDDVDDGDDDDADDDIADVQQPLQPVLRPHPGLVGKTIVASDNDVTNGFVKDGKMLPYVFEATESGMI